MDKYVVGILADFPEPEIVEPPKSDYKYVENMQYKAAPGNYLDECSQKGTITNESYNGINGTNKLNVYLPYGYDPNKQYNIFYLMHGGGENENTIFSKDVKLANILDHMIMNGELEPLIVVTPTFNKTEAGKFYDEFRKSVVPF
ncbi:MAG: glycoside hydrolase, partial [Ruminococcus sp.]|nr:glycoside hydrolase [Ruminococcus sp.]